MYGGGWNWNQGLTILPAIRSFCVIIISCYYDLSCCKGGITIHSLYRQLLLLESQFGFLRTAQWLRSALSTRLFPPESFPQSITPTHLGALTRLTFESHP